MESTDRLEVRAVSSLHRAEMSPEGLFSGVLWTADDGREGQGEAGRGRERQGERERDRERKTGDHPLKIS